MAHSILNFPLSADEAVTVLSALYEVRDRAQILRINPGDTDTLSAVLHRLETILEEAQS